MQTDTILNELQDAADEAAPYATAVIAKNTLHITVQIIQDQRRALRRSRHWFYVACMLVGLTVALVVVRGHVAHKACPNMMSLDPTEIHASREQPVWL